VWRRVSTGYAFPSARSSHSAALVEGWAPSHDNTTVGVGAGAGAHGTGVGAHGAGSEGAGKGVVGASAANQLNVPNNISRGGVGDRGVCAIVFGGLDSIQCASDTWALDLHWRLPGVGEYDLSISIYICISMYLYLYVCICIYLYLYVYIPI
jgi:hypothetical protein